MNNKNAIYLVIRYALLILFGLFNLAFFYRLFTPITVFLVYWALSIFDTGTKILIGNIIFYSGFYAEIIPACVAGAAYYLLLILNLSTPMKLNKRIKSIGFLFLTFLVLNVARIVFFMALWDNGFEYFNIAHRFVWYFGSTVLVVIIWFANVWLFKISSIPVYSDVKNIFGEIIWRGYTRARMKGRRRKKK